LLELLDRVHVANGLKSRRTIAAAMNLESASYVNNMLRGVRLPVDATQTAALVRALGGGDDDVEAGRRLFEKALAERASQRSPDSQHPWGRRVAEHTAWRLAGDPDYRGQAVVIAERLAALSGRAGRVLDGDPWLDADLADRFVRRIDWLLRTTFADVLGELSAAEAALLALLPLLHHTHTVRTLAALREIGPLDFGIVDGVSPARREYTAFCGGQRELVDRARAPALPDRAHAGREIGWWLFHRWVARFPEAYGLGAIRGFLEDVRIADPRIREEVLDARAVQRFLHGLRLDPAELADADRQNAPKPESVLFVGEHHEQRVRELLLGHILAVAYALALDLIRLPDIVVRHLGIPGSVNLKLLRDTVTRQANWVLHEDFLVLRADCHHPAELEGLRQYARQVDALLYAVRRICGDHPTTELLSRLPTRASADDVRPGTDEDGRPLFQRVSRFRLDERRVQALLMGEQLYQDRGLAIRELYQNALDACRWRQARLAYRSQQIDWPDDWEGRIQFVQGVENGRAYLECRDNGIGMTEAVLTEVFSQAGTRFTDLTEFLVESTEWKGAEPPIPFYPNSRFGVGVLSYFMIADEIEVVTRPLDRGQRSHPTMKVSIFGPGHLFRIEYLSSEHPPGTSIKLFLRDGERAPSCVEELRRLLGVAEFETVASHGSQRERWEPGTLNPRVRPSWQTDGLDVHGTLVPCEGGDVVWCEHGGGLLVDGIYVQSAVRRGVFAGLGDGTLRGVVVNLTGPRAPERLSVDRRQVLSDESAKAEELLCAAARHLVSRGRQLLDVRWIAGVTEASPRLGDLITEAAIEASVPFRTRTGQIDIPRAGCFLQDSHVVLDGDEDMRAVDDEPFTAWKQDFGPEVPHHVVLWRLMAHDARPELGALGLDNPGPVRPALPSDVLLLSSVRPIVEGTDRLEISQWYWNPTEDLRCHPGHILWTAMLTGVSPRQAAHRAVELGVHEISPERFPADEHPDHIDLALLSRQRNGRPRWCDITEPVPIGHLVAVALRYGIDLAEGRDRMEAYGFRLLPDALPASPLSPVDQRLLNWFSTPEGWYGWLPRMARPVPTCHIVQAAGRTCLSVSDVSAKLAAFGFQVEQGALPHRPSEHDLVLFNWDLTIDERAEFDPRSPLAPRHIARAAFALGLGLAEVTAQLAAYGVTVPEQIPDEPIEGDLELLSRYGDNRSPSWAFGESIPVPLLLLIAKRNEAEPQTVAARLAEYGMGIPPDVPPAIDELTFWLLSEDLDGMRPWLDSAEPVSRGHLIRAFAEHGIPLRMAAERLSQCGMSVPTDLPDQPDPGDIRLLFRSAGATRARVDSRRPVPLSHLMKAARETGMTVAEATERLRRLGMIVDDPAEVVADALRRLPRP
jgi:hypothetical protein